jgi:hypothetical protein
VASLNHPGGNATGVSMFSNELVAKRVQLLRDLAPAAKRVAVLVAIFRVGPVLPGREPAPTASTKAMCRCRSSNRRDPV